MNDKNSQKNFVEELSHELNNPIAVIEGHLKMLKRWGKDDPEVLAESIDASLYEIERMKVMVQDMSITAKNVDFEKSNDWVTMPVSVLKSLIEKFKLLHPDFTFNFDSNLEKSENVGLKIKRNHFEQILVVLLDNAVKYSMNKNQVDLSISEDDGNNHAVIAVRDFGRGLSKADQEQIFKRSYRVDYDKEGSGLGLSIAENLVSENQGKLWVDSQLTEGSVFYLQLPLTFPEND